MQAHPSHRPFVAVASSTSSVGAVSHRLSVRAGMPSCSGVVTQGVKDESPHRWPCCIEDTHAWNACGVPSTPGRPNISEGPALGGGCEGIEGHVCGRGAFLTISAVTRHSTDSSVRLRQWPQLLPARHLAHALRTCSGLRRVCFVCDDSEVLVCHSPCSEIASRTKGNVQGDDDDQLSRASSLARRRIWTFLRADLIGVDRSDRSAGAFDR